MIVKLNISAGIEFHQLFFALTAQRDAVLKDAITSIGPDTCFGSEYFDRMREVEAIDEMIIDLVAGLNHEASRERRQQLDQRFEEEEEKPDTGKGRWRAIAERVAENFTAEPFEQTAA